MADNAVITSNIEPFWTPSWIQSKDWGKDSSYEILVVKFEIYTKFRLKKHHFFKIFRIYPPLLRTSLTLYNKLEKDTPPHHTETHNLSPHANPPHTHTHAHIDK